MKIIVHIYYEGKINMQKR